MKWYQCIQYLISTYLCVCVCCIYVSVVYVHVCVQVQISRAQGTWVWPSLPSAYSCETGSLPNLRFTFVVRLAANEPSDPPASAILCLVLLED